jgi:hypothetical protein
VAILLYGIRDVSLFDERASIRFSLAWIIHVSVREPAILSISGKMNRLVS